MNASSPKRKRPRAGPALIAAMLLLWGASPLRAALISIDTDTLDHLEAGDDLVVDGFIFSDFVFEASATGGPSVPNPAAIHVTARSFDTGEVTLVFSPFAGFTAFTDENVNGAVIFKVTAAPDFFVNRVELSIPGSGADDTGAALVAESITDGLPTRLGGTGNIVANFNVRNREDSPASLLTAGADLPSPLTSFWVTKDITVRGGGGANGFGQLGVIEQAYRTQPIPEPGTLSLGAISLAALAVWRLRKHRRPSRAAPS